MTTTLPHATDVVRRLHDAVVRDVPDTVPPTRTGLVLDHNGAAELLDLIGRLCPQHIVCSSCGAHWCSTCGIDDHTGPWCLTREPLCGECSTECRRCPPTAHKEAETP